jgi:hypothetical protein
MFEAFIYHSSSIIELLIVLVQCMAINSQEKFLAVGGMTSLCLFSIIQNERFGLVFAKTGSINSGKKGWSRTLGWSSLT